MGVTVVGMSDAAEALLSSCVPNLQIIREKGNTEKRKTFFIFLINPPLAQPTRWSSL